MELAALTHTHTHTHTAKNKSNFFCILYSPAIDPTTALLLVCQTSGALLPNNFKKLLFWKSASHNRTILAILNLIASYSVKETQKSYRICRILCRVLLGSLKFLQDPAQEHARIFVRSCQDFLPERLFMILTTNCISIAILALI